MIGASSSKWNKKYHTQST